MDCTFGYYLARTLLNSIVLNRITGATPSAQIELSRFKLREACVSRYPLLVRRCSRNYGAIPRSFPRHVVSTASVFSVRVRVRSSLAFDRSDELYVKGLAHPVRIRSKRQ